MTGDDALRIGRPIGRLVGRVLIAVIDALIDALPINGTQQALLDDGINDLPDEPDLNGWTDEAVYAEFADIVNNSLRDGAS